MIELLNVVLNDYLMILAWGIPALLAARCAIRNKSRQCALIALLCVPLLIYFFYAASGLWRTHEVATAFNRSAQIVVIIIVVMLMRGYWRRLDN